MKSTEFPYVYVRVYVCVVHFSPQTSKISLIDFRVENIKM